MAEEASCQLLGGLDTEITGSPRINVKRPQAPGKEWIWHTIREHLD